MKRMDPKFVLIILSFIYLFLYYNLAQAGIIRLQIQTHVKLKNNKMDIGINIKNLGDVGAFNLRCHLFLEEKEIIGHNLERLDPGKSYLFKFKKALTYKTAGRYPLMLRVDYEDGNGYPFSALSVMPFKYRIDAPSDIEITGENLSIERDGILKFKLKNLRDFPITLKAFLFLPKELSADSPYKRLTLQPKKTADLNFKVINFSAREGSLYPVFCILEYDKASIHHTVISKSLITIKKEEPFFKKTKWFWEVALIVILSIVVIYEIKRRLSI